MSIITFGKILQWLHQEAKGEKKMIINPIIYEDGRGSDIYSKNLENRVIQMVGEVTDDMASSIVAQLLYLSSESSDDIQLYINSWLNNILNHITLCMHVIECA